MGCLGLRVQGLGVGYVMFSLGSFSTSRESVYRVSRSINPRGLWKAVFFAVYAQMVWKASWIERGLHSFMI